MTEIPVTLDEHRGMMAQTATELRRYRAEIEADQAALHKRRGELEAHLLVTPATTWAEAIGGALSPDAVRRVGDATRATLVTGVLDDFRGLSSEPSPANDARPANREIP